MMFLLRCAFWLSIVYSSIFWSHGAFSWSDESAKVVDMARSGAKGLVTTAASGATEFCARHAKDCLTDATRLTYLVRTAEPPPAVEPEANATVASAEREQVAGKDVPQPVPDPRRQIRDAKRLRTP